MAVPSGAARRAAMLLAVTAIASVSAYAQSSGASLRDAGIEPFGFELRAMVVRSQDAATAPDLAPGRRITEVAPLAAGPSLAIGEPGQGTSPVPLRPERTVAAIVRNAVMRHPAVESAAFVQEERVLLRQAIEGTYYPQVSAAINPGIVGGASAPSRALNVGLNQRLTDFGRTRAKEDEARAQIAAQSAVLSHTAADIAQQIMEATIGVQRGEALAKAYDAWVADVSKLLDLVRDRARSGLASQADPMQAAARVSAALNARLQAATALRTEQSRLRLLLAGEAELGELQRAALPRNLIDFAAAAHPFSAADLPVVRQARAEHHAAQARVESAKAAFRPTLALEIGFAQPVGHLSGGTETGRSQYGMVTLKSDLFDGGVRGSQLSAALKAEQAALARVESVRLFAEGDAARYRHDFENATLTLKLAADQKHNLFSTLERYRDQYTIGSRSILDLLNTEQEAYLASIAEINADFDRHLAGVRIAQSAGRLLELLDIVLDRPQALAKAQVIEAYQPEGRQ